MTKIVTDHYAKKEALKPVNVDNLKINTDLIRSVPGYCRSSYQRFYTVPLLVYFFSREIIRCQVNPNIYVNATNKEINKLLESNKEKLDNKQIEIAYTSIPNSFNHSYKHQVVSLQFLFFGFTFYTNKNETYSPIGFIKLNYVVRDKTTQSIIKQGELTEQIANLYTLKNSYESRKKFVEDFVNLYDINTTNACQLIAQNLVNQL
ncbi:MAG: hypothetical protein JNJ41_19760 [Bacteroidia bacterium]|nr:hypothetical protein [Bacteroidia bacterium]